MPRYGIFWPDFTAAENVVGVCSQVPQWAPDFWGRSWKSLTVDVPSDSTLALRFGVDANSHGFRDLPISRATGRQEPPYDLLLPFIGVILAQLPLPFQPLDVDLETNDRG